MISSAFALSLLSMIFSATSTTSGLSLIVIELSCGFSAIFRTSSSERSSGVHLLGVAVGQEERADDLVLQLGPLRAVVLRDVERVLVDDLVEVLELHHQDVHRLLEADTGEVDGLLELQVLVELVVVEEVDARRSWRRRRRSFRSPGP
jgi:hypothetical protein